MGTKAIINRPGMNWQELWVNDQLKAKVWGEINNIEHQKDGIICISINTDGVIGAFFHVNEVNNADLLKDSPNAH